MLTIDLIVNPNISETEVVEVLLIQSNKLIKGKILNEEIGNVYHNVIVI